mgnify:FL=1|tara:strand:+ start:234 stop:443 length:210 start_codon:yes stop_codon:yes gene_type:complete
MGKNKTIYLTVAVHINKDAEVLNVIDEMDYFFEHSAIESTEIQEVLTEEQMMKGMSMEDNSEYFRDGRF